ncbi:hypothetical protein EYZ11_006659 [Aspergillus tanneri]|uniref:BTB domain-containing protein n=1 Tax=Aspergillus tanneri TaxID=1220188 RepID=A0A4S3JEU7_9EURO|nr:hypothetical protein EYZ11_006659 [Aspergillus tanneri]
MEACRDYSSVATDAANALEYSIIQSPPFTFLVGANHTKLTVQTGLARHVSKPLDHLMNSGLTRESKHHIAMLEEEDVETFVAFCEYAYTGDYSVPPPGSREEDQETKVVNNPFRAVFDDDPISPSLSPFIPPPGPKPTGGFPGQEPVKQDDDGLLQGENAPHAVYPGDDPRECTTPTGDNSMAPLRSDSAASGYEEADQPPPGTTPAAEDDFSTGAATTEGKNPKRNKKDKKKQNPTSTEEPASNLTPPSTPPPADHTHGGGNPTIADDAAEPDAWKSQEQPADPVDAAEPTATGSSLMEKGWQPVPTPSEARTADNVKTDESQEIGRGYEAYEQGAGIRSTIDTSFAKQYDFSSHHEKGINLWDEFTAIDYADSRITNGTRPPSSMSRETSNSDLPYLIFHAKLYVFATRYLIPALAQLCLRKLHRDLLHLDFPDNAQPENLCQENSSLKARMILDLLHYTYTRTTRLEPISPTSATQLRENELRKLVIHYAACKVRDLAKHCPPIEPTVGSPSGWREKPSARGMRALLDSTTELASDLVYRMM